MHIFVLIGAIQQALLFQKHLPFLYFHSLFMNRRECEFPEGGSRGLIFLLTVNNIQPVIILHPAN